MILECLYDLQGDSLYSVKWYRNGQEFYRHIPTDRPQTVVFRQAGLIVDVSITYFTQDFTPCLVRDKELFIIDVTNF